MDETVGLKQDYAKYRLNHVNEYVEKKLADPFYSVNNLKYLEHKMADYKAGNLQLVEYELIEE